MIFFGLKIDTLWSYIIYNFKKNINSYYHSFISFNHRGKDFTKTLIALLALFSFSAVVTFIGAMFHSITLGYWKLISLCVEKRWVFSRWVFKALVVKVVLSNLEKRWDKLYSQLLTDFHTSINLTSAASWFIESQPSLSSIFFTLMRSDVFTPQRSLSMSLNATLMPSRLVWWGCGGLTMCAYYAN